MQRPCAHPRLPPEAAPQTCPHAGFSERAVRPLARLALVQEVSGHRVVIFSKVICPSSRKAKEARGLIGWADAARLHCAGGGAWRAHLQQLPPAAAAHHASASAVAPQILGSHRLPPGQMEASGRVYRGRG